MINSGDSEPQVRNTMAGEGTGTSTTHVPSEMGHRCSAPATAAICRGKVTVVRAGNPFLEVNHPIKKMLVMN